MSNDRYNRNILFFREEGQKRLSASKVAVVGLGGVGVARSPAAYPAGCPSIEFD